MAKRSAIELMYNAIMAIGAIDDTLHSPQWSIDRAQQIVNETLREMHTEHIEEVQQALGFSGYRKGKR